MVEAPKVHCPKEDRMVPIWWCLGSFVQQRYPCPELLEATVKIAEDYAEVKCKAQTSSTHYIHAEKLKNEEK